ncbi:MAG: biosynthetic arginine decarboxylase [Bdellovibrionales bacterium]|nr:biosynthetic arginine decarboxylase [Bdellovibrionales bacterium]
MKPWGVSDSLKLYQIEHWGDQYFNINPGGNLTVHPRQGQGPGIDLMKVIQEAGAQGLEMPLLVRFQDIIRHRVIQLNESMRKAIAEANYPGRYQGVYPIKVNQMREVVEEVVDAGRDYDYGLEAGSKAELTAVLSQELQPNALIIVNGYKDYSVMKLAMMGIKLGKRVIVVIEKLSEVHQIVQVAKEVGVIPQVGVRCKLNSKGSGKWESSGGELAKFGLTTPEILYTVNYLKEQGFAESVKLLHFHVGSQVTNIRTIKDAVKEASRFYAELYKMGFKLEFLDVGGGLGVDYDGSHTDFESSMNYSLQEYCADVVYSIQEICANEEVPVPNIVSESGRAIAAHHSVLIVNIFGSIEVGTTPLDLPEAEDEPVVIKEMRGLLKNMTFKNMLEYLNEAINRKEEAMGLFKHGQLNLQERAIVEHLFWKVCRKVHSAIPDMRYVPEEVEKLTKSLSDQYLANFSIFQSMPDHWAIGQLFPVVPIHRLDEEPTRNATLVDITCDSDGKVSKFVDLRDVKDTLRVHPLKDGEPYYMAFFLTGAYQDIMGDLHNLFGKVNEVHAFLDETEPGGYYIEEVIRGNNIASVLSWIQYSPAHLEKEIKQLIDKKVREGVVKPREGVELQNFYENVLQGYTYIDHMKPNLTPQNLSPQPVASENNRTTEYLQ